jgi:hypothetical protein
MIGNDHAPRRFVKHFKGGDDAIAAIVNDIGGNRDPASRAATFTTGAPQQSR